MPKMKSHSGAKKRVKITGSGKLLMNAHHRSHKRTKKRREKIYSLRTMHELDASHRRRMRRLLPYA